MLDVLVGGEDAEVFAELSSSGFSGNPDLQVREIGGTRLPLEVEILP